MIQIYTQIMLIIEGIRYSEVISFGLIVLLHIWKGVSHEWRHVI